MSDVDLVWLAREVGEAVHDRVLECCACADIEAAALSALQRAVEAEREENAALRAQRDEALAAMASDGADACLANAPLRTENAALRKRIEAGCEAVANMGDISSGGKERARVLRILRGEELK